MRMTKMTGSNNNMVAFSQTDSASREIVINLVKGFDIPSKSTIRSWVELAGEESRGDVFLNFVTADESRRLNQAFRKIDEPTNVLSFPAQHDDVLGDVAICVDVAKAQADEQEIALDSHLAHLVIHGVLHLRGFDHVDDQDADAMERKEVALLKTIGVANPYE